MPTTHKHSKKATKIAKKPTRSPKITPKQRKATHTRNLTRINDSGISFVPYIYRVVKQVHPDIGITVEAMNVMRSLVDYLAISILKRTKALMQLGKRQTVSSKEIRTGTQLSSPEEFGKYAAGAGARAVTMYNASFGSKGSTRPKITDRKSISARSDIIFSVSRAKKLIYMYVPANTGHSGDSIRVGIRSSIYLAGVLEYITKEILEIAMHISISDRRQRIKRRHIMLAIRSDLELSEMFPKTHVYI